MPAGPSSLGNKSYYDGPRIKPKTANSRSEVSPLFRPGGPKRGDSPLDRLIPIEGPSRKSTSTVVHTDPFTFWSNYYKTHNETAGELHETVRLLGANHRMRDVQAVLVGYLTHHGKNAEAWMYRALALAIHMNHGSASDVAAALNYAADLAQRTHNPNDLVSVADTMALMGHVERQGALLDEAAVRVPHLSQPLKMSVNLALLTKDPARMGDAIEKLLALGWPGEDDYIRAECRRQVQNMANTLREDGRSQDAATLEGRLAEGLTRDVFVRLSWDGYADYDLAVDEPLGVTASYDLPRTVFGGSVLGNGFGKHSQEVYVCPRGFDGDYTIHIRPIWADPAQPVVRLKLETIAHEGTPQEKREVYNLTPEQIGRTFVIHLNGGRRKTVLPYIDPRAGRIEYQAKGRPATRHTRSARNRARGNPPANPGTPATLKDGVTPKS